MKNPTLLHFILPISFLGVLFFSGCATVEPIHYRSHPEFKHRLREDKVIVAAPADIKIKQIGAGGIREEIDEYSDEAERLFSEGMKAAASVSGGMGIETIAIPDSIKVELEEASLLAATVLGDIEVFSYNGMLPGFQHKVRDFRYSVGDMSSILDETGGDAMLFIFGLDYFTTTGRKAINGMLTLIAAAAQSSYIATEGVGGVAAMLVDRDGEVLWITRHYDLGLDLRKEKDVDAVVGKLLADLKKAKLNSVAAEASR